MWIAADAKDRADWDKLTAVLVLVHNLNVPVKDRIRHDQVNPYLIRKRQRNNWEAQVMAIHNRLKKQEQGG